MTPLTASTYATLTNAEIDQLESDLLLQVSRLVATLRATRALYDVACQHHAYNHETCLERL